MRRWLSAIAVAVALTAPAWAGNSGDLDGKPGWKDLTWGSAPPADMVLVEGVGGLRVYRRKSDTGLIGDYVVDDVLYVYAKDQLYSVIVRTSHPDAATGLLQALSVAYGKPQQPDSNVRRYVWDTRKVALVFDEDDQGDAKFVYTYMPLDAVKKQAEQESVDKAAKELQQ